MTIAGDARHGERMSVSHLMNADLLSGYLEHAAAEDLSDLDQDAIEVMVSSHLELAARRLPDQHLVRILHPLAWPDNGCSLVQIVTTDRPFLVDSLGIEVARQGWTVRRMFHPQPVLTRDADGVLEKLSGELRESWITFEAYPPLGSSAEQSTPGLIAGLEEIFAEVAVVVDDWPRMAQAASGLAASLRSPVLDTTDDPGPLSEEVADLLEWLVDDHFIFLGHQHYQVREQEFTAAGDGLGVLRGRPSGFHAAVPADHQPLLVWTRDPQRSRIRRQGHVDHLAVRHYRDGVLASESRFLGLLDDSAQHEAVRHIPVLAAKAGRLLLRSGYRQESWGARAIERAIAEYPRDELFQASEDDLLGVLTSLVGLGQRRVVRVFLRADRYSDVTTVQVYLPRERHSTGVRRRIERILLDELGGVSLDYTAQVSDQPHIRLSYVVRVRPGSLPVKASRLTDLIEQASRSWEEAFLALAARLPSEQRGVEFPDSYQEAFTPQRGLTDLALANQLRGPDDLRFDLVTSAEPVRLRIVSPRTLELSALLPHLGSLGVELVDERPFELELRDQPVWIYDLGLRFLPPAPLVWEPELGRRFVEAFEAAYLGRSEPGRMNRLVVLAGLSWQEVTWLRAIARYLMQAQVGFSQLYIADCLNQNPRVAAALVSAFRTRFEPQRWPDAEQRNRAFVEAVTDINHQLESVTVLDHDRIIRMFVAVLQASERTNAFQPGTTVALKIAPERLTLLPEPRPSAEIFVYSPRVQGVHLRFGPVARGGLRWSDRKEDFRTEVLGLVKAQTVKNTVIVPVGAKGGFVPQLLPDPAVDRSAWLAEGQASYQVFIDALLSLTDNLVGEQVVPPQAVVRWDGDDPYLVVAADKGTATFSDLANEVAASRGFWLGDAFASGGSQGYDHKRMGITARGAWESVRQHLAELGIDPQRTPFSCVAIGDMAGDVFGNGMLASDRIRLVAAFNHQHIFLDPDPDQDGSYLERRRLFELPRSSWADYDPSVISAGGGVHQRSAKSIPITDQVREALGLPDEVRRLSPAEVIRAILRAPVDLLFNGGIGTYVKASSESDAEVMDKANDAVRVDADQVRARCVAEGGNLGWTQRGRVEYAQLGGRINTDFIDNSAGVDTSDHEVNIKILLTDAIESGHLAQAERQPLLASMTDEIAVLVLRHNREQNVALSNAMSRSVAFAGQHEAWMRTLESEGLLDRRLEFLPDSAEMEQRISQGRGLSRPELAVLMAHTKIALKRWVLASALPEDPYLADRLVSYFPSPLRDRFADRMPRHRLARQIITTVAVNRFVDSQGMTAYHRLSTETGAGVADMIRAQLATRSIFSVGLVEVLLARLDGLQAELQTELRMQLRRMVERGTRWLLHNRRSQLNVQAVIEEFAGPVQAVTAELTSVVTPRHRRETEHQRRVWIEKGASPELAARLASAPHAHVALPIADVAARTGAEPALVAEVFFQLGSTLGIDRLGDLIDGLPRQSRWDAMARAALRDEVIQVQADLTAAALAHGEVRDDAEEVVVAWLAATPEADQRSATLTEVCSGEPDLARLSVGLGLVRGLR